MEPVKSAAYRKRMKALDVVPSRHNQLFLDRLLWSVRARPDSPFGKYMRGVMEDANSNGYYLHMGDLRNVAKRVARTTADKKKAEQYRAFATLLKPVKAREFHRSLAILLQH